MVGLDKQCAGYNRGVSQLLIVSKCLRDGCQASLVEKAHNERRQVGSQIGMGPRKSRGTGALTAQAAKPCSQLSANASYLEIERWHQERTQSTQVGKMYFNRNKASLRLNTLLESRGLVGAAMKNPALDRAPE